MARILHRDYYVLCAKFYGFETSLMKNIMKKTDQNDGVQINSTQIKKIEWGLEVHCYKAAYAVRKQWLYSQWLVMLEFS